MYTKNDEINEDSVVRSFCCLSLLLSDYTIRLYHYSKQNQSKRTRHDHSSVPLSQESTQIFIRERKGKKETKKDDRICCVPRAPRELPLIEAIVSSSRVKMDMSGFELSHTYG